MAANNGNGAWHLDKRVPLALVALIVMQSFAAVWWASAINERMAQFELAMRAASDQSGRIIKLETQGDNAARTLDRLETKVDKILDDKQKGSRP